MWVEIESSLICHFLVPGVRFSVRKVEVKLWSYLYWKHFLFLAPWMYFDWPKDMSLLFPICKWNKTNPANFSLIYVWEERNDFRWLLELLARKMLWIQRNSSYVIFCASAFCVRLEIISLSLPPPSSTKKIRGEDGK